MNHHALKKAVQNGENAFVEFTCDVQEVRTLLHFKKNALRKALMKEESAANEFTCSAKEVKQDF